MNSLPAKDLAEWASIADDKATREREETLQTYLQATKPAAVSEYLTDKGFEEELQSQLGYCEKKEALVIPAVTGEYGTNIIGFIYRSVKKTEIGYSVTDEYRKEILIGDPGYVSQQDEDLIIVHDPLDLYRLRNGIDIKADGVSRKFSVAISNNQISKEQADRLKQLNPRSIIFIRGYDSKAKELEDSIRRFCLNEVIRLGIVVLSGKDISDYLKKNADKPELKEKIEKAKRNGGLLDRTARSSDELFSWLATQPPALKTGYEDLDKNVRIPVGAMTIIAGRPKHGKTTFLYNLMMQMAESGLYEDKKFYFFSYEENGYRIKQKMLSRILQASGVTAKSIALKYKLQEVRSGDDLIQKYAAIRQKQPIKELDEAAEKLDALLMRIEVVNESFTVEELDKMIRKLTDSKTIAAIFIDYMQRIRVDKERGSTRENMNHVSDVLKWCAVNTGLPLIVGAQIGRKADENERPSQSDIKESGNLEEDANLVLGVFNETQAQIDRGVKEAHQKREGQNEHTIQVYTMNSRDSEPSQTSFVMTNRHFKEV